MGDPKGSSSFSSRRPEFNPLVMNPELWLTAEHRIYEILCSIQPVLASEKKRQDIMSYLTRLIKAHYSTEVFAFGSVPLKTYLPDGDIDLTILSHQHMETELIHGVLFILEWHVHDPKFNITAVQRIKAQVQLVKCVVNGICVDISFNQLEGLSTVCFMEEANRIVGKDNLLKRSLMLIKSWCYYESRLLGGNAALFSTYALEILVLHIINLFHSSLGSPLTVLYKFLDYYNSFDWENCGVSLNGVILVSSLPTIVAKPPAQDEDPPLLGPGFLSYCRETYAVPVMALDRDMQEFGVKFINIVDPLKENNNLGRSVNKASFTRIKGALSFGARMLHRVLFGSGEHVGIGLENFFANSLARNGRGQRPDADVLVPPFGTGRYDIIALDGDYGAWGHSGPRQGQQYHYTLPDHFHHRLPLPPRNLSMGGSRDVLPWFLQQRQTVFHHPATEAFLQRGFPMRCRCPAKLCTTFSVQQKGTGTFIPKTTSSDSSSPTSEPTSLVDSLIPSSSGSSEETAELEKVDVPGERIADKKEEEGGLKNEDFPPLTKQA
ncbi:hypothetical protein LINGRAHAP2_LOCUS33775 [Linum grandiflorum]